MLDDENTVRDLLSRHAAETGSPGRRRRCSTTGAPSASPASCRATTSASSTAMREAEESGQDADELVMAAVKRLPWLTPTGFLKHKKATPRGGPVEVRLPRLERGLQALPDESLQTQATRCMDCGIPFCHNGCPLGNLIPEWNDLSRRGHWDEAIERLHATNNFPEFTGTAVPGSVRGGVRARHRRRPGDHQADRGHDHRPGVGPRARRAGPGRRVDGQAGRRRRQRSGGSRRRPAADAGRARGRRLRAGRPHRRPAALRHPRVQDGEARPQPAPAADGAGGHQVRDLVQRRRSTCRWRSCGTPTTPWCSRSARPSGAAAGRGPRARGHPPGDGVPDAREPGAGGRPRETADHRRRQARRDHRRRRHRRRLPGHRAPPGGGLGDAAGDHAAAAGAALRRRRRGRPGR